MIIQILGLVGMLVIINYFEEIIAIYSLILFITYKKMECLEEILIGKAQALDIPIDIIKEFVEKFNSEIPGKYPKENICADINDLTREGDKIELKWTIDQITGILAYDIMNKSFSLSE